MLLGFVREEVVLLDGAPREQTDVLEHHAAAGARAGHRLVVDEDLPRGLRDQAGDDAQQRRLAASARAEHRDEAEFRERDVDVAERLDAGRPFPGEQVGFRLQKLLADVLDPDLAAMHGGRFIARQSRRIVQAKPRCRRFPCHSAASLSAESRIAAGRHGRGMERPARPVPLVSRRRALNVPPLRRLGPARTPRGCDRWPWRCREPDRPPSSTRRGRSAPAERLPRR